MTQLILSLNVHTHVCRRAGGFTFDLFNTQKQVSSYEPRFEKTGLRGI